MDNRQVSAFFVSSFVCALQSQTLFLVQGAGEQAPPSLPLRPYRCEFLEDTRRRTVPHERPISFFMVDRFQNFPVELKDNLRNNLE